MTLRSDLLAPLHQPESTFGGGVYQFDLTAPQVEAAPEVSADDDAIPTGPKCGFCGEVLDSPRDLDTGYHTTQWDAYSCWDRMRECD